jgi:hypothetical protein
MSGSLEKADMAHLVMDTLIAHEVDFVVTETMIAEREAEWRSTTSRTRSKEEYVKAVVAFAGLELIKYEYARIDRSRTTERYTVQLRSQYWADRQAVAKPGTLR